MSQSNILGKKGEEWAIEYLKNKGYKIMATNWHYGHAEIDIIAEKDNILAIIEVKTRWTNYFGEPEEFVSRKKQRLIIQAADAYIRQHNINKEARFDIISILYNNNEHKITHIEDAFYPLV